MGAKKFHSFCLSPKRGLKSYCKKMGGTYVDFKKCLLVVHEEVKFVTHMSKILRGHVMHSVVMRVAVDTYWMREA